MRTSPVRKGLAGRLLAGLAATALTLSLAACGGGENRASDPDAPLRVGVSPVPHGEILRYVQDELATEAGLKLEIVEFSDYIQPNVALEEGQLDANYFQHVPYLEDQEKSRGYDFTVIAPVHLEPLGVYSQKVKSLEAVPAGAEVAIPNDVTNAGRALNLLAAQGLLTLREGVGTAATVRDVTANPKNLRITELEAAQVPRSLADVDLAVINGNYALEADLNPAEDALALEKAADNPYANVLVTRTGDQDDPRVRKLAELLTSAQVREFVETTYHGTVLPAAG